jgi:hypothetical protein
VVSFFRLGCKCYYSDGSREYLCLANTSSNQNIIIFRHDSVLQIVGF